MVKCPKCGNDIREGQKFCTKCGSPLSVQPLQSKANKSLEMPVCSNCGNPIKQGQKFCTKCGTPIVSVSQQPQGLHGQKGWFTDGVRAIANAVTGGALNRQIQREQQLAVRQQTPDQAQIRQAEGGQQTIERLPSAEEDVERARDRRNQEAIDGIDVVRGRAIWNIQPGQIARRITEAEFNEIEALEGIIIQEGCTAVVYIDGELVGMLSGGAYTFSGKTAEERKAEREAVENEVINEEKRQQKQEGVMDRGLFGTIGIGLGTIRRFFFGNRKGESQQKQQVRREKVEKILKEKEQHKLIRVYLVSDRVVTLTFGGLQSADGLDFVPFKIATKLVDLEIGVSLQMQISNINEFLSNYLADRDSVTTINVQQLLQPIVQTVVAKLLRNLDYQQEGLSDVMVNNLRQHIQIAINEQLRGIECVRVLQVTDRSEDFDRFRAVERELFCAEKELEFLQRTGEFRNRLAIETNKQEIEKARNDEELRYALQQVNRDQLLHDDELEDFLVMLNAQKRLRVARSQEEEYEALIEIKKSRLVKDDELAALEDALAHNKIERDSVTEIMRVQHQQSIDDARLKAQWALDDQRQDHEWEREELQRRRNWGIEDEEREREWMHEEQEYNRRWGRTQKEDEYDWQKRIRETDFEWQNQERQREALWQQRQREEQMRREQEQLEFARQRQSKFDDIDILDRKAGIAQRNMQAMKDAELRELQEQNRSTETIHSMDVNVEMNRDNNFANMSAEQIRAAQLSHLDKDAQVAMANAYSKDGENELIQKQQQEQKELYEKMMQMQKDQGGQTQEMMLKMAQMMQQGMVGIGQQQQTVQQQRFEDQRQRANEYRDDAQRQQERMDHTLDQSLNYTTRAHQTDSQSFAQAMGGVPHEFKQIHSQQGNQQPQIPAELTASQACYCPACGAEVPKGEKFCGECGNRM